MPDLAGLGKAGVRAPAAPSAIVIVRINFSSILIDFWGADGSRLPALVIYHLNLATGAGLFTTGDKHGCDAMTGDLWCCDGIQGPVRDAGTSLSHISATIVS